MKKILFLCFLVLVIDAEVFCHKRQLQKEPMEAESITQILYYFPEANVIYENLCLSSEKLSELAKNMAVDLQEYDRFCHEMNENLCEWEILQKNLALFQSKKISFSYRF